jgi:hypothetical protein
MGRTPDMFCGTFLTGLIDGIRLYNRAVKPQDTITHRQAKRGR